MDIVPLNIKNDDSVQRLIDKTAQKLQNKYYKKRKINENLLGSKSRGMEIFSRFLSIVCIIIVAFSALLFVGIVNSYLQGVPASFAGFTSMKVASGSMVASGFKKGDNVIAKSVNTKTLKEGCIIAFYRDWSVSDTFDSENAGVVDTSGIGEPKYQITLANFFGTQNEAVKSASKANYDIIFHKIYKVYECDGVRWFQTYGTSNFNADGSQQIDGWYVREDLVLGIYADSFPAKVLAGALQLFSSSQGVILALIIPLVIFGIVIFFQFLRDIQMLKLQLDVVEEKRTIDDPICVKYQVGYHMDNKMKYKVLAQANDENKNDYISFLWEDGKAPENIRKYCLRKKMYLKPVEKLLEVNRICQEKLNNGEKPRDVAKFYLKEKKSLQKEQLAYERKFRKWLKEDKIDWVSDEELNYDDEKDELNIRSKKTDKIDTKQEEQIVVEIDSDNIKSNDNETKLDESKPEETKSEETKLDENKVTENKVTENKVARKSTKAKSEISKSNKNKASTIKKVSKTKNSESKKVATSKKNSATKKTTKKVATKEKNNENKI